MHDGAQLAIGIAGRVDDPSSETPFDHVVIGGTAKLDGALEVALVDTSGGMYSPVIGDTFPIVSATGGISGSFDAVALPELPLGLQWETQVTDSTLYLLVTPKLPGDYNGDGSVDAADFVVWRKSFGQTGVRPPADGSGPNDTPDGIVDSQDYTLWRANFGHSLDEAPSTINVPESDWTHCILIFGFAFLADGFRVRRRQP
jgi:hypothetical protein